MMADTHGEGRAAEIAPTAANLAASLRAMRRAAQPHYSATGQQLHAVVMNSVRIGDLTDAADLIERLIAAQQAQGERA